MTQLQDHDRYNLDKSPLLPVENDLSGAARVTDSIKDSAAVASNSITPGNRDNIIATASTT